MPHVLLQHDSTPVNERNPRKPRSLVLVNSQQRRIHVQLPLWHREHSPPEPACSTQAASRRAAQHGAPSRPLLRGCMLRRLPCRRAGLWVPFGAGMSFLCRVPCPCERLLAGRTCVLTIARAGLQIVRVSAGCYARWHGQLLLYPSGLQGVERASSGRYLCALSLGGRLWRPEGCRFACCWCCGCCSLPLRHSHRHM